MNDQSSFEVSFARYKKFDFDSRKESREILSYFVKSKRSAHLSSIMESPTSIDFSTFPIITGLRNFADDCSW